MKPLIRSLVIASLAAAVILGTPTVSLAAEKEKGKDKAAEKGKKEGVLPYNGKAVAVDKAAKTVKLSGEKGRVIQITATTKIDRGGKAATLDDLKEGEEVSGGYKAGPDGKLEATILHIGPKAPAKGKKKEEKK